MSPGPRGGFGDEGDKVTIGRSVPSLRNRQTLYSDLRPFRLVTTYSCWLNFFFLRSECWNGSCSNGSA